jgi:membrane protease YdiL (CAAX protease family)
MSLLPVTPIVIAELIAATVYVGCLLSLTWFFRNRIDGRSLRELGLKSNRKFSLFGIGILVGLITFTACMAFRLIWGLILFDKVQMNSFVASSLVSQFLYFTGTGVCEEIAFRGYVFQTVRERYTFGIAVLVMSVLFLLVHVPAAGLDPEYYVLTLLVAVLLARRATGSLWMGIGWHAAFDWSIGAVFGSSGTAGLILVKSSAPLIANEHGERALFGLFYDFVLVANVAAVILWSRLRNSRTEEISPPFPS